MRICVLAGLTATLACAAAPGTATTGGTSSTATSGPATTGGGSSSATTGGNPNGGTWSAFTKTPGPIFTGQYPVVGDPSVLRDATTYRMAYTCFDPLRTPQGPEICEALSSDGLSWTDAPVGTQAVEGRLLETGPGVWDTAHETSFLLQLGGAYSLYFVGYVDRGGFFNSIPSAVGYATSTDGLHFTRNAGPVLQGTPGGYDSDLISSPSVVALGDGGLLMIYSGYCLSGCAHAPGVSLLAASSADGVAWTKLPEPVIQASEVPWANQGVAECDLKVGPDGDFYLFMTVLQGAQPHQLGVARSASALGPWQVDPNPIVVAGEAGAFDAAGDVAPSALFENGKVRVWFHGFSSSQSIAIGYAEASWPLVNP